MNEGHSRFVCVMTTHGKYHAGLHELESILSDSIESMMPSEHTNLRLLCARKRQKRIGHSQGTS